MAKIGNTELTDEQFMLVMELGKILKDEGYAKEDGKDFDPSKLKSERGKQIVARLEEIAAENREEDGKEG